METLNYFNSAAATGLRLKHLLDLIEAQIGMSLEETGSLIKFSSTGIVLLLHYKGALSVSEIASTLKFSHQLTTQRINWLKKSGFVVTEMDELDKRCKKITLTESGVIEGEKFLAYLSKLEKVFTEVFNEIGIDIYEASSKAYKALIDRPINGRIDHITEE